jgi:hypothetical protein
VRDEISGVLLGNLEMFEGTGIILPSFSSPMHDLVFHVLTLSGSDLCFFGDVVEAGVRAGPGEGLLRLLQNAIAFAVCVGARFSRGNFLSFGRH